MILRGTPVVIFTDLGYRSYKWFDDRVSYTYYLLLILIKDVLNLLADLYLSHVYTWYRVANYTCTHGFMKFKLKLVKVSIATQLKTNRSPKNYKHSWTNHFHCLTVTRKYAQSFLTLESVSLHRFLAPIIVQMTVHKLSVSYGNDLTTRIDGSHKKWRIRNQMTKDLPKIIETGQNES